MTPRVNVVLTAIFVAVTALGVALFDDEWRGVVVVVDLSLFAVGVVTFILGYFGAVGRSRSEEISVAGAFLPTTVWAPRQAHITNLMVRGATSPVSRKAPATEISSLRLRPTAPK
ncbi:MAG: hypothetical protein ACKOQZ_12635 [Actinomycetota bacterium]